MKIVVSFTTSPKRIHLCRKMINSILRQSRRPNLILLNIPRKFERTGEQYKIPEDLSPLVKVNIIEKDLGPITKILPTIEYLRRNNYDPKDTQVIYLDDDVRYQIRMVSTYFNFSKKYRNSKPTIFCTSGLRYENGQFQSIHKHFEKVDIVEGYGSVCAPLAAFEIDFERYILNTIRDSDSYYSDDIILSSYFWMKGYDMRIINKSPFLSIENMILGGRILDYGNESDALYLGADGKTTDNNNRYIKVLKHLKTIGVPFLAINKPKCVRRRW